MVVRKPTVQLGLTSRLGSARCGIVSSKSTKACGAHVVERLLRLRVSPTPIDVPVTDLSNTDQVEFGRCPGGDKGAVSRGLGGFGPPNFRTMPQDRILALHSCHRTVECAQDEPFQLGV